jgi:SAM-dependent methyltransferase
VTVTAAAEAYDRFMGRDSSQLAAQMADLAGVQAGQRVVDVGSGPGALTRELVDRLGASAVSAIDPADQFVAALRDRYPGVDAHVGPAEDLPFADGAFDAALAQLVVHFMADPLQGLREMARVTRDDGVVAACVWDNAGGRTPLAPFWNAALELDPDIDDESELAGTREGHLGELFLEIGLREVEETALLVRVEHETFEEWWEPFSFGVGPAGAYLSRVDAERQAAIRDIAFAELGEPFTLDALAWAARGVV